MRSAERLFGLMIASLPCIAQVPVFQPERVLPSNGSRPIPLAPGLLFSIYGEHLGPQIGCEGMADTRNREMLDTSHRFAETLIYPKDLCDTQALVDSLPSSLLYVNEKQLNFKAPQHTALQGTAEIRVIHKSQSSAAFQLPSGS